MSVTVDPDAAIPHGLEGYRPPWRCKCAVCRKANAEYTKAKRDEYKQRDELAVKRRSKPISTKGTRAAGARRSESKNSVPGEMEVAVREECSTLPEERRKPSLVVAAVNLAKSVDILSRDPKCIAVQNSTTKQLMAVMADLRGDKTADAKNKRKSGGRLATVGALTKVKRAQ